MGKNGKSGSKTASGYQAPIGTYSQAPKKTVDFKIVEKDNETWEVQNTLDLDEPLFTVTVHNNDSHKFTDAELVVILRNIIAEYGAKLVV